jgi:hypothetical protein
MMRTAERGRAPITLGRSIASRITPWAMTWSPGREIPAGRLRFAPDSPLEGAGFEPTVPRPTPTYLMLAQA